ncbi:MAG: DUF1257 domain-containing protein [Planctomycetota bacterium]|mgnify:CR=1 FL=1|nr:MAG: DUF1257 domain-containing protein [Planctomycetota bacterium]REK28377.1 MAG: DUF1257 domain-containing protein [Planctomycetota bacterium]REK48393.1 MAG: DUF1257 domain-containing protein [Planctomycetota bacterium]
MSHIVTIETEVRDTAALAAACRRLGFAEPALETAQLFSGQATGHCVRLPDWRYPVVCDTESGQVQFDNFQGRWGEQRQLDRLMQAYACEKAKLEARRRGHTVTERPLADGSIQLTVHVGGAA